MRHRQLHERGNAVIEFALGLSVLALLFTGIFQFGWSFYQYNRVQTLVSNAAVLAARLDFDADQPALYTTAIKNAVVYGSPGGGTIPIVSGLSTANVNVNVNPSGGMPTDVTITVRSFTIDAVFARYNMTNKPRVTSVYMGHIVCSYC
jgi:Flp pilus assembly protein TadG